jgi:hypothetical protein
MDRVIAIEDQCDIRNGIGNCLFALYSIGHDYKLMKGGGTDLMNDVVKYKYYGPHKCDWILRRAFRGWDMVYYLGSDIASEDDSEQEHTDTSNTDETYTRNASQDEKTARDTASTAFMEKVRKIHKPHVIHS